MLSPLTFIRPSVASTQIWAQSQSQRNLSSAQLRPQIWQDPIHTHDHIPAQECHLPQGCDRLPSQTFRALQMFMMHPCPLLQEPRWCNLPANRSSMRLQQDKWRECPLRHPVEDSILWPDETVILAQGHQTADHAKLSFLQHLSRQVYHRILVDCEMHPWDRICHPNLWNIWRAITTKPTLELL